MGLEIERQFLVRQVDDGALAAAERIRPIRQAYLTESGMAIRVRTIDDGQHLMTVKGGGGLVRQEVEFPLPTEVARALYELVPDRVIEKTRYVLGPWEVDVFEGRHEGLVIAEIEFAEVDHAVPPPPPGVELGLEVTEEAGFTNQFLSGLDSTEARALVTLAGRDPARAVAWVRARTGTTGHPE